MGKVYMMSSGSGNNGSGSDDVTAVLNEVLEGTTAITYDSNDEPGEGTMTDMQGTTTSATASLDSTNSRLQFAIPARGCFDTDSKLYAAYSTIRSLIGLTAAKIRSGYTILGLAGTFTSDATASASDILSGETAYVDGSKVTGTMTDKSSSVTSATASLDSTNSRLRLKIPANGYYDTNSYLYAAYSTIRSLIGLTAAKIRSGYTILGLAGTFTSDATASASDILSGETAYVDGSKVTGTYEASVVITNLGTKTGSSYSGSYSWDATDIDGYSSLTASNFAVSAATFYLSVYAYSGGSTGTVGGSRSYGLAISYSASSGKVTVSAAGSQYNPDGAFYVLLTGYYSSVTMKCFTAS